MQASHPLTPARPIILGGLAAYHVVALHAYTWHLSRGSRKLEVIDLGDVHQLP